MRHLEKGRVCIFAAGTGNPYFTTDTAAVLRGQEIHAEVLLKATKVDAVYDSDPKLNPDARRYEEVSSPDDYANEIAGWIQNYGVQIVGGCCGTDHRHLEAICKSVTTL